MALTCDGRAGGVEVQQGHDDALHRHLPVVATRPRRRNQGLQSPISLSLSLSLSLAHTTLSFSLSLSHTQTQTNAHTHTRTHTYTHTLSLSLSLSRSLSCTHTHKHTQSHIARHVGVGATHARRRLKNPGSKRRGITQKRSNDLFLQATAIIRPWLSYMCRNRSRHVCSSQTCWSGCHWPTFTG